MNTMTERPMPIAGAPFELKEQWLATRRGGITATEVGKLRNGSDRRKIAIEKLTGESPDLTGNKYIDRGNEREPIIAAWIEDGFDIAPNSNLYIAGDNPRRIATPDGVSNTFEADRITAEIKTSKWSLNPGPIVDNVLRMDLADEGTWKLYYWAKTSYYDQVQWQMLVMGGDRTLFVWEQHDDQWDAPGGPKPLSPAPEWCWILRDEVRIAELISAADAFLAELEVQRSTNVPASVGIAPDRALLVADLIKYRNDEAIAKAAKESVWAKLKAATLDAGLDDFNESNDLASVSLSTSTSKPTTRTVLDEEAMRKRAPKLVERYDELRAKFTRTETVPGTTSTKLTVTAKKGNQA